MITFSFTYLPIARVSFLLLRYRCRVDDMKLESFEGLGIIPIDILQRGSKKIVEYMLDFSDHPVEIPSSDPS